MHKLLLTLFLFVIFFFPKSDVFAQTPCPDGTIPTCPAGSLTEGQLCEIVIGGIMTQPTECKPSVAIRCKETKDKRCPNGQLYSQLGFCTDGTPTEISLWKCDNPDTCPSSQNNSCTCKPKTAGACEDVETCTVNPTTGKSNCTGGSGQSCTPGSTDPNSKGPGGIRTAIGCVPTEPKALVEGLLKYGTLAAGGIAFLIMIIASLQMITAEGNPESIKGAQEKFYSAIIGLLLIIFAVLLMQVIGVDILGLPELRSPLPRNEAT